MNRLEFNNRKYYKTKAGYYLSNRPYKYIHRDVWEYTNGTIPDKNHIHHIDGNKSNNAISNLECLSGSKHISRHAVKRVEHLKKITKMAKDHQNTPEAKREQSNRCKEAWATRNSHTKVCTSCGGEYNIFWKNRVKKCKCMKP